MSVTASQLLEQVEKAIYDIVSGQASQKTVTIGTGTTSVMALDLDGLKKLRRELRVEIQEEENGGYFERAVFGATI